MSPDLADTELKYLYRDRTRHGQPRVYVRLNGQKTRLTAPEGTAEFLKQYLAARENLEKPKAPKAASQARMTPQTLEWLGEQYMRSAAFRRLDAVSQRTRRAILEGCFAEPPRPGATSRLGQCPLDKLEAKHLRIMRERKAVATPGAANNRLKYMSAMLSWAVEENHVVANVARDVKSVDYQSDGFHTWEPEEVAKFEQFWPVGSKPRLALALMLFLGVRRGDAVHLGRQHIRPTEIATEDGTATEDWLKFTPSKTRNSTGAALELPILDELASIIAATTCDHLTFLTTKWGKPFTAAGFGNWFRERCDEAGLPQCSAHGLRKAGATVAANRGATTKQLMALYGWADPKMAETYIKKADQKILAQHARKLLARKKQEQN